MKGIQQLIAFAETAKRGSFARASRELGTTPSTLAKAVARLEQSLGVKLFHRTTRRVTLTADGERLFHRCQRVLAEIDDLQAEAAGVRAGPAGTLRIDMPVVFGRKVMLPLLASLAQAHPALEFDIRLRDDLVDLIKDGIDLAVRIGPMPDSSLVAQRFASQQLVLCASPAYLERHGVPRSIEQLAGHSAVRFRLPATGRLRPWQFATRGRTVELDPPHRVQVSEGEGIAKLLCLGMGLGQLPDYMVADELARGELVEVLPSCRPPALPISAVYPSGRMVPPRVRAVLGLLAGRRQRPAK